MVGLGGSLVSCLPHLCFGLVIGMILGFDDACGFFACSHDDLIFSRDLADRRSTRGLLLDGGSKLYPVI